MNLGKLIEGINIIREYYDDKDGYHLGADHHAIYLYSTDRPIKEKDIFRLIELGFFQDLENGEYSAKDYNQEESWKAYI